MQTPTVTPVARRHVVCRSLAALAVVAALAVAMVDAAYVVVVDGRPQPTSRVVAGLLATAMVIFVVDAARRSAGPGLEAAGRRASARLAGLAGVAALFALVTPSLIASMYMTGLAANWTTLTPTGPDGCVLIARETADLNQSTLYTWREGDLLASAVAGHAPQWGSRQPFRAGEYEVTWDGDVAQIRVLGDVRRSTVLSAACS